MTRNRSQTYGASVERQLAETFRLELDRSSWHDARRPDGRPVEIKAARYETDDRRPGRFKLYEEPHRTLRAHDGFYALGCYMIRGRGAGLVESTMVHASRLPPLSWHGGGEHRDTRQATLSIDEVDWR